MNQALKRICVSPEDTIQSAMARVSVRELRETGLPAGLILIVNKNRKLLGIATDGDVRRALSRGISQDMPISQIMNSNPFLIEGPKTNLEILSLITSKIKKENLHKNRLNKIIIVNKGHQVEDVISFYDLWQQSDARSKSIGIVGLGYVGLTLALTLADLGFKVNGLDTNPEVRVLLRKGKSHFLENGLDRLLKDHIGANFRVVDDFRGVDNCDVYFVNVGTPLNKSNRPDLNYLKGAVSMLGKVLKSGDTVILRSTVPVGTTRNVVAPLLEKISKLKAGEDFFVAFAPERTAEGAALQELRRLPQVIGGINRSSSDSAASVLGFITNSIHVLDKLEEAEMVKLINNTYRDLIFGYANEVAIISKKWGLDTQKIIEAANKGYERSNVPKPSPGVGGYCLEKDPFIFIESARQRNYNPLLFALPRQISAMMINSTADEVINFLKDFKPTVKNPKILILGLAFKGKPVTSDTRGSATVRLIQRLKSRHKNIHVYDSAVVRSEFAKQGVRAVASLEKGFSQADAVVVMNNHPEFEALDIRNLLKLTSKPAMIFDGWALYNPAEALKVKGIHYQRL